MAQLCLTYTYNFEDQKYKDYVNILAVLAQIAIDSAKRSFDLDLPAEIKRISQEMEVDKNGLPEFWQITKQDKRKCRTDEERREKIRNNKEKIRGKVNKELICPMNFLYKLPLNKYRSNESTIPIGEFLINHIQDNNRRKSKKVEELIEKYSLDLHNFYLNSDGINYEEDNDNVLLIRSDFDKLITDIRSIYISSNYLGLMSWLINRAFMISEQTRGNMNSNISKNKALLMKILYTVNPEIFLKCFRKSVGCSDLDIQFSQ